MVCTTSRVMQADKADIFTTVTGKKAIYNNVTFEDPAAITDSREISGAKALVDTRIRHRKDFQSGCGTFIALCCPALLCTESAEASKRKGIHTAE